MGASPLMVSDVYNFVLANQPVTATEARYHFEWPNDAYAQGALDAMENKLGVLAHTGDYWSAVAGVQT